MVWYFTKHDINGNICKGTFKLYNLNDRSLKNFITFTAKLRKMESISIILPHLKQIIHQDL